MELTGKVAFNRQFSWGGIKDLAILFFAILAILWPHQSNLLAVDADVCLECHEGEEGMATGFEPDDIGWGYSRKPGQDPADIDLKRFRQSVHRAQACTDCHTTASAEHDDDGTVIEKVKCWSCHDQEFNKYKKSVHGEAMFKRKDRFAPICKSCHGNHYILPPSDPESSTHIMNIPETCGRCHKEGTSMTDRHDIPQHNIVENYSMSIHRKALYERGLTVAPVCVTCHGSHEILRHEDPASKINKANVPETCMQCHARIDKTHKKMVLGRMWQKETNKIPVCVECHMPHDLRQIIYDQSITDAMCLECHSEPGLTHIDNGRKISLYVNEKTHRESVHREIPCVKCHFDTHPESEAACNDIKAFRRFLGQPAEERDSSCSDLRPVDCAACHEEAVLAYTSGIHGIKAKGNDPDAPNCSACHGTHDTFSRQEQRSRVFPLKVPELCGQCHREGERTAIRKTSSQTNILDNYAMSIHGKGLQDSGLLVSATCSSCHSPHRILPAREAESTVNHKNIPDTCANCHFGINEIFQDSVHSPSVTRTDKPLPVCNDCHSSHTIKRHDRSEFRLEIIGQCGDCHQELMDTYFDTYHGKVSKLGESRTAKCSDCHGSHNILTSSNIDSTLNDAHIEETCGNCHDANRNFTGYLPHSTHDDPDKYPLLFYSFWGMNLLLIGTFVFFGIHTVLWLIRLLIEKLKQPSRPVKAPETNLATEMHIRRFRVSQSLTHLLIIVSFMTLALTGMTLKFPDSEFFVGITHLFGGPMVMGYLHRIGAFITFIYVLFHLGQLVRMFSRRELTVKGLLTEEYTMIPVLRDLLELKQNFLYFIGRGPKPKFGRWSYWEKFDYMAVFWGIAIIGSTGMILWFAEIATLILPGWVINVATIIHSDEALLAAGFIFTIHFFNTHLRPHKFPMDPAIFTQRTPLSEYKEEHPREYRQMVENGSLDEHLVEPPAVWFSRLVRVFGITFLVTGVLIVGAIIYSMLLT